jgi:tetratricopeptide (TPR) repeat protein
MWLVGAAVLCIATIAAFAGSGGHTFVSWDDPDYIYKNPMVLNATATNFAALARQVVSLNFHPLTMWSLWLNVKMSGPSAGPMITTNIIFHIANVLLVYSLLFQLSGRRFGVAFFSALLFAVHPLRVESVVWVSERKDVLYVFFFLLSCLSYLRYLDAKKMTWLGLTGLFFLLSCLSKATAVVLPLVLLLIDYWKERPLDRRVLVEKIPLFAGSLLFGLMALNVQGGGNFHGWLHAAARQVNALSHGQVFSVFDTLRFAGYGFTMYIVRLFAPFGLSNYYPYPNEIGEGTGGMAYTAGLFGMVALLGIGIWAIRRMRVVSFGIGFYLVALILVLQFVAVGRVIMADRYSYLPHVGLLFMLTYLVEVQLLKDDPDKRRYWWAAVSVFALFCLFRTREQSKIWTNTETLWKNAIALYPQSRDPYEALGNWCGEQNRIEEAAQYTEKAIQNGSEKAGSYSGLANAYAIKMKTSPDTTGRAAKLAKIGALYAKAIQLEPNNADNYLNRAVTFLEFDPAQALEDLNKADALQPSIHTKVMINRGATLINLKRNAEALPELDKALQAIESSGAEVSTPEMKENRKVVIRNRAVAKFNLGDKNGAAEDIRKALSLDPNDPSTVGIARAIGQ